MCPELVEGHDKHASTGAVLSSSKGSRTRHRVVACRQSPGLRGLGRSRGAASIESGGVRRV